MHRNLLAIFAFLGVLLLAWSAWASQEGPAGGGGESELGCICRENRPAAGGTEAICGPPPGNCETPCDTDADCTPGVTAGCAAGRPCICQDTTKTFCDPDTCSPAEGICAGGFCTVGGAPCTVHLGNCKTIPVECDDGGCDPAGPVSDFTDGPPWTRIPCPKNTPTLSQWGLILFGLMLLTAMFVTVRRRGVPPQMTASLLALMSAGVIAVSVSYAEIQENRSCGDRDVAVDFVDDLLNG